MAIKIQGTDVITDGRVITNIEGIDNIIQKPVNISPDNDTTNVGAGEDGEDTTNFNFQLTISQFSALLGTVDTVQFQISDTSDFSNIVIDENITALGNSQNTLTITDVSQVLTEGTTYYWRARYFDTGDKESLFTDPTEFTTAPEFIYVDTPSITTPTDEATGVGEIDLQILAESSAFSVNNDPGTGDHESTDWQVATDSDFSNIIFESLDDTSNLTSIDIPRSNFSENTEYFIRVRHHGVTYGDSLYSAPVSFTSANNFIEIETPTITSPSESDIIDPAANLTVTASSFNLTSGQDTHQSTDWQFATDSNFSNIAFQSIGDTSNLTSITISSSNIDAATEYFIRVRYNSGEGAISNYSQIIEIAAAVPPGEETYLSPGSYTFTVPTGVNEVFAEAIGAGGDGGNASAGSQEEGGAGAGYASKIIDVSDTNSISVTVGGSGGTSSVGSFFSATGGENGAGPTNNANTTSGGSGVGGTTNYTGGSGGVGDDDAGAGGGGAASKDGDGGNANESEAGDSGSGTPGGTYDYQGTGNQIPSDGGDDGFEGGGGGAATYSSGGANGGFAGGGAGSGGYSGGGGTGGSGAVRIKYGVGNV